MRKQYYFRPSQRGLQAWDVDRLIAQSKNLPRKQVSVEDLGELDRPWAGSGEHDDLAVAARACPLHQRG